jgi:hypothetical protein
MHLIKLKYVIAVIGCGLPASAPAQESNDPIVVTGESLEKARQESLLYLRGVGMVAGDRQVARWMIPVCPNVVGIPAAQAEPAVRQLRKIIAGVGAPLAAETCKANFVVVLSGDPKSFMAVVARRGQSKLKATPDRATKAWLFGDAKARWWYDTSIKSRDNLPAGADAGPHVVVTTDPRMGGANAAELPGSSDTKATNTYSGSLVSMPTIRAISAATVVVDFNQAARLGLTAVIDHAALVGLAEVKYGPSPESSILSLFDDGSTRRELSNRDYAFLTALYRIPMDRKARLQRTALINQMTGDNRTTAPDRE